MCRSRQGNEFGHQFCTHTHTHTEEDTHLLPPPHIQAWGTAAVQSHWCQGCRGSACDVAAPGSTAPMSAATDTPNLSGTLPSLRRESQSVARALWHRSASGERRLVLTAFGRNYRNPGTAVLCPLLPSIFWWFGNSWRREQCVRHSRKNIFLGPYFCF